MAAPTLTLAQKRSSLRSENDKKKIIKNVLVTPVIKRWPLIEPDEEKRLLDTVRNVIAPLNVGKLNKIQYPDHLTNRKKKNEYKKKKRHEHWVQSEDKRSLLAFGINNVTKCLEKDQLSAVLVCWEVKPAVMTQHLISLCLSNKVIAASIRGLKLILNDVLQLKSCAALGFKRGVEDPNNLYYKVYEVIRSIYRPLPDVYNQLSIEPIDPEAVITEYKKKSPTPKSEDTVNVTNFYVYKSSGKFIPKSTKTKSLPEDFIPLDKSTDLELNASKNVSIMKYKMANIRQVQSLGKMKRRKLN